MVSPIAKLTKLATTTTRSQPQVSSAMIAPCPSYARKIAAAAAERSCGVSKLPRTIAVTTGPRETRSAAMNLGTGRFSAANLRREVGAVKDVATVAYCTARGARSATYATQTRPAMNEVNVSHMKVVPMA